jgi:hypothetical protein
VRVVAVHSELPVVHAKLNYELSNYREVQAPCVLPELTAVAFELPAAHELPAVTFLFLFFCISNLKRGKLVVCSELPVVHTELPAVHTELLYGWIGQQSGSGFINLAPSILHYNWF